jgi:hypothetical protein
MSVYRENHTELQTDAKLLIVKVGVTQSYHEDLDGCSIIFNEIHEWDIRRTRFFQLHHSLYVNFIICCMFKSIFISKPENQERWKI